MCLIAPAALAQDPLKVGSKYYKLEFENSQVRVLRVRVGPHEKVPMHEHPAHVVISLTDGHSKFTLPDGTVRETHGKAGQVIWSGAEKHESENLGEKPAEAIIIELKAKAAAAKSPAAKKKG